MRTTRPQPTLPALTSPTGQSCYRIQPVCQLSFLAVLYDMIKELQSPTGRVYLTIDTDTANRWVFTDWMGYLTAESIRTGAAAYTAALATSKFNCVLNDTRSVRGPWDHSMDWVINTWAPDAAAAGLKYFALVSTPESLADGSAANFYAQLTAFHAEVFDNLSTARAWLLRMQAKG